MIDFKDLKVWQKAHQMTLSTYRVTSRLPRDLQIARGSASEAEYHFLLARDLRLLDEEDFTVLTRQADELQRMLTGLIQSVRSSKIA
jgi:hypothetical protein